MTSFGAYCAGCDKYLGLLATGSTLHHDAEILCGPCASLRRRMVAKQPVQVIKITAADKP